MASTLTDSEIQQLLAQVADLRDQPRPSGRQPVHTLYGGAQIYKAGAAKKMGQLALQSLDLYAPNPIEFARTFGLNEDVAFTLRERVLNKLAIEPLEDQRIDFEDGYGYRPNDEEDADARRAAEALADGMTAGDLPPYIGIRIKSLNAESGARALRTLNVFMSALLEKTGNLLPDNFVVCLPKVSSATQVAVLADALASIESNAGLSASSLKLEIMVETTSAIIDAQGHCPLRRFIEAADGRCVAAHFGTYDYTADCDISAAWQTHDHLSADFARQTMQVALSGSGIRLSDGATTRMPVPLHRKLEATLTEQQEKDNRRGVQAAWREHFENIQRSMRNGFYQSWDLNPAQLPARYAAVYAFFQEALPDASTRLQRFVEKAAQATLVGSTFDDAATGQGLLNFFQRGIACGALTIEELEETGLSADEISSKSFMDIAGERPSD